MADHVWTCPRCGREVIGEPGHVDGGGMAGRIYTPPNEAELVAQCPEHGHAPWNDPTWRPKGSPDR